jgi:hypothetical protein
VLRSTASAGVKKKRNAMCCGSAHQDGDSPGFQFSISSISNKEDGGEKNASLEQQQQNQGHRVVAELQQFQQAFLQEWLLHCVQFLSRQVELNREA